MAWIDPNQVTNALQQMPAAPPQQQLPPQNDMALLQAYGLRGAGQQQEQPAAPTPSPAPNTMPSLPPPAPMPAASSPSGNGAGDFSGPGLSSAIAGTPSTASPNGIQAAGKMPAPQQGRQDVDMGMMPEMPARMDPNYWMYKMTHGIQTPEAREAMAKSLPGMMSADAAHAQAALDAMAKVSGHRMGFAAEREKNASNAAGEQAKLTSEEKRNEATNRTHKEVAQTNLQAAKEEKDQASQQRLEEHVMRTGASRRKELEDENKAAGKAIHSEEYIRGQVGDAENAARNSAKNVLNAGKTTAPTDTTQPGAAAANATKPPDMISSEAAADRDFQQSIVNGKLDPETFMKNVQANMGTYGQDYLAKLHHNLRFNPHGQDSTIGQFLSNMSRNLVLGKGQPFPEHEGFHVEETPKEELPWLRQASQAVGIGALDFNRRFRTPQGEKIAIDNPGSIAGAIMGRADPEAMKRFQIQQQILNANRQQKGQ